MSLKFYTDTHVDKQVAIQLRARGVDVVRCQEVGLADADDETHLTYAAQHQRVLITKDRGFWARHFRWLSESKAHSGIFFCPDRQTAAIGKIVTACYAYVELIEAGAGTLDDIQNEFFEIV